MVKLEEVMDEEFVREQEGPHDEDEWDTDSESDLESENSFVADETLYERITALKDIVPASTRRSLQSKYDTVTSWTKSGLLFGGKTLWVISTSALLLGVPWALAYSEEQMIVEQERAEMMNQRAQNEFMAPGANDAKPAL
ncbi:mitochondrial outer membrane translocase complex, subunit Tom22 [Boeremia exigua]|uniref:mitochondrial outer membrane translocase complex, subunit Tom22 n=1 Tax=Boeremia exigua TaxID=749465 RepID=UPI001E8E4133|nr:mitochondrial outer membrane translocase complex, subunit Tom22 [Boeremia exigua]KAH6625296.1 mitochondrial outer membrane translocase complex, subunit Tom22 [Boeremia exigua]